MEMGKVFRKNEPKCHSETRNYKMYTLLTDDYFLGILLIFGYQYPEFTFLIVGKKVTF